MKRADKGVARKRSRCPYCGAKIDRGRGACASHADLIRVDPKYAEPK